MATSYPYESSWTVDQLRSAQRDCLSGQFSPGPPLGDSNGPKPVSALLKEEETAELLRKYRMRIEVLTGMVKAKKRDVKDILASNSEFKLRIRELENALENTKHDLEQEKENARKLGEQEKLVHLELEEKLKEERKRERERWDREKAEWIDKLQMSDQHQKCQQDLTCLKLTNQSLERKLKNMDQMFELLQESLIDKGILDPQDINEESFENLMRLLLAHVPHVDEMKSLRDKSRTVESRHNETQTSEYEGQIKPMTPTQALKELSESFGLSETFLVNFLTVLLSLKNESLPKANAKEMVDSEAQTIPGLTYEQVVQLKAVSIPAPSSKTT